MFSLERTAARQQCCFYCNSLQWVSLKDERHHLNNVESLYTIYGPREGDTKLTSFDEWVSLHGLTPLCTISGWDPSRAFDSPLVRFLFVQLSGQNLKHKWLALPLPAWHLRTPAWLHAHYASSMCTWLPLQCALGLKWRWKPRGKISGPMEELSRLVWTRATFGLYIVCFKRFLFSSCLVKTDWKRGTFLWISIGTIEKNKEFLTVHHDVCSAVLFWNQVGSNSLGMWAKRFLARQLADISYFGSATS